jgi:hypothetical protein
MDMSMQKSQQLDYFVADTASIIKEKYAKESGYCVEQNITLIRYSNTKVLTDSQFGPEIITSTF